MSDIEIKNDLDAINDPEVLDEIVQYLTMEVDKRNEEVVDFFERVDTWIRQREAQPKEKVKTYPFEKASNVCVPQALSNTQAIYAALKATFGQKKPFWSTESEKEEFVSHADSLSKYLNILAESKFHLDLRNKNNTIFYELASLGTQFVKVPYLREQWSFKKKTEVESETVTRTLHDGPAILPIRLQDFFARGYVNNIQKAKWVGIRHNLEFHELKQYEQQGFFSNVDEVSQVDKEITDEYKLREEEREGITRVKPDNIFEIFECYVFWDLDKDGVSEDIKIWFDWESKTVLRAEYNGLGFRDIVRIPYIQFPFQLYAMGVGWMCEYLQEEVDALHNQRIDSAHMSMMQGVIVQKASGQGDLEIEPGFIWEVENPRDVQIVKFPEVGNSSVQAEYMVREYADRATGANNAMMGHPDQYAKSRATASGTMFLAQQSSRLFDAVVENVEEAYDQIGLFVVLQLMDNKDDIDLSMLDEEDMNNVKQILSLPFEDIHLNFSFKINTSEIEQTDEAKKQALLTFTQLYDMYVQKLIQVVTMLQQVPQNSPVFNALTQAVTGMNTLMEDVVEKFNYKKDDLLINMKNIEMMSKAIKQMGGGMNEMGQVDGQMAPGQGVPGGAGFPVGPGPA